MIKILKSRRIDRLDIPNNRKRLLNISVFNVHYDDYGGSTGSGSGGQ